MYIVVFVCFVVWFDWSHSYPSWLLEIDADSFTGTWFMNGCGSVKTMWIQYTPSNFIGQGYNYHEIYTDTRALNYI